MRTIYKYNLDFPIAFVDLPEGAEIVHAAEANDDIFVWAIVDTDAPTVSTQFVWAATGRLIPDGGYAYVATVITAGESVLHLFRETPEQPGG